MEPLRDVHRPDSLIGNVGDIEGVVPIAADSIRFLELGLDRRAAIAAETGFPTYTGDGGDGAGLRGDGADAEVQAVHDVEIVVPVKAESIRLVQHGFDRRTAVAAETVLSVSSHRGNDAGPGRDPAHAMVPGIREIEIAGPIEGDIERLIRVFAWPAGPPSPANPFSPVPIGELIVGPARLKTSKGIVNIILPGENGL